jgi:hypothetical protein
MADNVNIGTEALQLSGLPPEEVYKQVVKQGVSPADAAILVSGWIFQNFGKVRREFNYITPFGGECGSFFNRTLVHTDWVDGESVVQAGATVTEQGFNARFHAIEHDLDAIKDDLIRAFNCMVQLTSTVQGRMEELRNEINRINSDIFDLSRGQPSPTVSPANFSGLVEGASFQGTATFNERAVSVWKTPQGFLMLPAVNTVNIAPIDPARLAAAPDLAKHFADTPAIANAFAGHAVTKKEMVEKFGNDLTQNGLKVSDILNILPDDASFPTLNDMVNAVAERQAAAIRTTAGAGAAITSVLGLEPTTETSVGALPVTKLEDIPEPARQVLVRNGIDTVEKLAQADPAHVAELVQKEGLPSTAGDAAAWRARASTLNMIR